jgi:hypothetical protein
MLNPGVLIPHKRTRFAFTISSCVLTALFLFGCGPSGNTGPIASSPSPEANKTTPAVASNTNEYSIGSKINFAENGNSKPFKVSGWSEAERTHSWTDGPISVLAMRIAPTTEPLTLKMKLAGFAKEPEFPFQPVTVYANDEKIANWNVREPAEFTAPIPPAISQSGGLLTITLKIPKAASPKALGMSQDPRLLGLACMEVSLTATQ